MISYDANFIERLCCHEILTDEKVRKLIVVARGKQKKRSKKALDEIVLGHFRLVFQQARRIKQKLFGVTFLDLIQEGIDEVILAVKDGFDLKMKNKFIT